MEFSLAKAVLALAMIWGPAAHAGVVLSDNFNTENGGASANNYAGFANWNSTGSVNLVATGGGITCAGGSGSCVTFDGASAPGEIVSKQSYAFSAGQKVTLSFDFSGNQINPQTEKLRAGFRFGAPTDVSDETLDFGHGPINFGGDTDLIGFTGGHYTAGSTPWTPGWVSFVAGNSGTLQVVFATTTTDPYGPYIDNVNLSIAFVPEPATWAMLMLGVGGIGAAMRRGRPRDGAVCVTG